MQVQHDKCRRCRQMPVAPVIGAVIIVMKCVHVCCCLFDPYKFVYYVTMSSYVFCSFEFVFWPYIK